MKLVEGLVHTYKNQGVDEEDLVQEGSFGLMKAIERGDVQAGAFIRDTAGEKPTEKISAEVETITPEDRKQIERILNRTKTQDIVVDGN